MEAEDLQRAWVALVQAEAERGLITCRMCKRPSPLDEALAIWRNGLLIFAVCDRCSATHEVVLQGTERGIEVRARSKSPLVVGGR